MIGVLILDLVILAALFILGYAVVRLILGRSGPLVTASLAFPIGAGTITWLLFLISWQRVPLTILTVVITYTAALALALLLFRVVNRRRSSEAKQADRISDGSSKWPARATWALLTAFLIVVVALAIGRSHSRWDAAAGWIVKGYGIALQGDIRGAARWGAWGLAYPLNIPLLVSLHRLITVDALPGSMFMFPLFAFSAAVGIYRFWRRSGVGSWARLLGVGLFIANPLVLLHSTIGYANLPVTTYVVLGTCWMIEGLDSGRKAYLFIGSLLFGLASWTRSDALAYGLFTISLLVIVYWLARKSTPAVAYAVAPFAIIAGSWLVFSWSNIEVSNLGSAMGGVLPSIRRGEFRLWELQLIPRLLAKRALLPDHWGLLFPVAGLLIILGARKLLQFPRNPRYLATFLATSMICLIPMGFFYVRSFTRFTDFAALLHRSFDRAFLPGATMLLVLAFLLAFADNKKKEVSPEETAGETGRLSPSEQPIGV